MTKLHNQILQLEHQIPNLEKSNKAVSTITIGWQIDHCLLVINGIIGQLEISNPDEFKPKMGFYKFIVFATGNIPRGKARAPKAVTPSKIASVDELKSKIEFAKQNIQKFSSLPKNAFFNHPIFGNLNAKQAEKFLAIHTNHHLKIIEDILK